MSGQALAKEPVKPLLNSENLFFHMADQIDALDDYYGSRFQTYQRPQMREMLFDCYLQEKELHEAMIDSAFNLRLLTLHQAMDLQLKLSHIKLSYYTLTH